MDVVTLALPCRTDEPALGRTLAAAMASWRRAPESETHRLEVLVCLNGTPGESPRRDVRAFVAREHAALAEIDVDADGAVLPPVAERLGVIALGTTRAGKSIAWNILRRAIRGPVAIFADADVSFTPDAFGLLLAALAGAPAAVLASAKTTCAARRGLFEGIMAAPYGVDFPNLSPQLYAARLTGLPAAMPEDLMDPERWLELTIGHERIVRVPDARVAVRLPGTLADFFRQRIRIEMGKVQLAREYPGLAARGAPQPRTRATLASLDAGALARLGIYLALRAVAHAAAWWRYRRAGIDGVWRQAPTTKQWDGAA